MSIVARQGARADWHAAHLLSADRIEAMLMTPRCTIHTAPDDTPAPTPTIPAPTPRDADDLDQASRRGMASATSMLALCLHELDGTDLERGVARDIARRVVCAYLDQMQLVLRRTR
jgi:hypothetical protein